MDLVLRRSILLHALLLNLYIKSGYNNQYEFKIVDVHGISPVSMHKRFAEGEIVQNPLYCLPEEEQWDLCIAVRDRLSINGMEPDEKTRLLKRAYQISHIDGTREYVLGLECPTIPEAYPYTGKSNNDVMIPLLDTFLSRFVFERQVVEHIIVEEDVSEEKILENPLHKLTGEEQRHLCTGAKFFASADGMEPDSTMEKMAGYKIIRLSKTNGADLITALPCSTTPSIFLSVDPKRPSNLQVISEVEFLNEHHTFSAETITMAEKLQPEDDRWKTLLKEHYFSTLNGANRWHMCWAAHSYIRPKLWVIWSPRKSFEDVGLYKFQYEDGSTAKHVVIPCSTLRGDAIFVRSGDLENKFNLLIFGDNFLPEWSPLDEFY